MKNINFNKLDTFLNSLDCSTDTKIQLQEATQKQALGLHSREVESFSTNDDYTNLTVYYKPIKGHGDFDWIRLEDAYHVTQAETYQDWFTENQNTTQYLPEEFLVGDIVKLANGDFVMIKSFLRNYSIPNVGECITGIFDTKDNFHSIDSITKFQEQCCLA